MSALAVDHDVAPFGISAPPALLGPAMPIQQWSGVLAVAASEVLTGVRQVQQLTRWLDSPTYGELARRAGLIRRLHGQPQRPTPAQVRSVHVRRATAQEWEVWALVHDGTRLRAIAARVEQFHGRWRANALEIG